MDFSQYGEPVNTLDFSSSGEPVDLSGFGEPVDGVTSAKGNLGESARRAGTDIMTAADMIASLPGFALKVGERGMLSVIAALDGAENPIELANKIAEDAYSQGWRKWTMTPIESTLEALGVKTSKEGTVSGEVFEDFGKAIESGAKTVSEKTGSTELGEAGKQLIDIGMLGLGTGAIRGLKPKEPAVPKETIDDVLRNWKKPQEETQFVQDPADLFPETLETPYGTITGRETGWSVDANGIPINRAKTNELQTTEASALQREMDAASGETSLGVHQRPTEEGTFTPSRDFELEPRPITPEAQMELPWEQVDPNSLKTRQEDFDWTPTEEIDFSKYGTPEQGIEHIQRIPTDVTPLKGEIPYQESLGLNASGESAASMEAINRLRQEQAQGIERYKINPETGQITPLITADRVDTRASKGEAIIQVKDGKATVLENNSRMSDQAVQGRSNYVVKNLGGTGKKGFGQGGAVDFTFGDRKKIKELTPAFNELKERIAAGVQDTLKKVEEYQNWKFQEGDRVRSPKTGRVYEITSRTWNKKDDVPMYNYKSIDGDERGQFRALPSKSKFNDTTFPGAHDSLELLTGPKKLGETGFGKGQGGSWTPFGGKEKTLEDRAKSMKKDDWVKEFNTKYPGHEGMASDMYDRFSRISAAPKSSRMGDAVGSVTETLDKALGSISTRLGNVDPQIKQQLIDFEIYNSKNSGNRLDRVDKFLDNIYSSFPLKEDQATIKSLLLRNDFNTLEKVSPDSFKKELGELRSVLDETGDQLVKYGIIEAKRDNYFPRIVNDLKGLYKAMGVEQAQGLQKLIREKERAGGALSDIELADITNRYIQNNFRRSAKPGFSRERKLADVPPEWEQFYAEPAEALHTYLRSATFQIERAKFFGKNAERDPVTGRLNVEQSIGNLLVDLTNQKRIKPEQVEDVASIIRSRFGSGQSQSNAFWQGYKDLTHFATLGDIGNTAMQLADLAVIAALDGIRPTVVGIAKRFGGEEPIRAKDFGLMNRISDDFVSDRATTRLVNATFKYTGLSKVDEAVKDVLLNVYKEVGRREAISGKPSSTLFTEYKSRFGDEFPQLVKDLQEGKRTELTDRFVLSELANRQPIFKSEYSQAYLDNPNSVRPALVLSSFMLKSADFMRLRAYNQIKNGNKAQGYANLAKIATGLALGNVAMDTIRDYIANRPVDEIGAKQIAAAMAGVFRFNEYFSQDIQQGAWGEAAMGLIAPPIRTALDQIGGDLASLWSEDKEFKGKSIKLIPLVGDELYGWSEYGQEARDKQERRMAREEMKE